MSLFKKKLTVCNPKRDLFSKQSDSRLLSRSSKRQFLSVTSSRTKISYNEIQSQQTISSRLLALSRQNNHSPNKSFWENPCDKVQKICNQQIIFHEKEQTYETEINLSTRSNCGSIHDLKAKKKQSFSSKPGTPMNKLKQSQFLEKKIPLQFLQISHVKHFDQTQLKFLLNY